jgi:ATP-dependent Lon protease
VPTALAFLSVFLQRPVPQDIASSGVLVTESHEALTVRAVGEADYKVKAAYHCDLRALILPAGNRLDLERSAQVPSAIVEETVRYAATLDEVLKLVFGPDAFL